MSPSSSVGSSSLVRSTILYDYVQMPPKRTSTSAAPAMTQDAIRQLVADSVAAALEAQAATMANTNNTNRNTGTSRTLVARKGTNDHKRKIEGKKLSELMLPPQLKTKGILKSTMETFLCVQDAPYITQEFALLGARLATRWVIRPGTREAKDQL
ncbi:hypothetical protein Tco_0676067 [Tanacetum coccineum]